MSWWSKIIGDSNKRELKKLESLVREINQLEPKFEKFSREKLKEQTKKFKKRLKREDTLDDILPEAFALVREAGKRTLKQRHFDVQLMGGIVLHQGKIAEMRTGEGKTLAATLPLYLNALAGKGCHLVTVNDYLARRDAVWMGQIYYLLGLSVGCINHESAYLYDPTYKIKNEKLKNEKDLDKLDETRDELGGFKVVEEFLRPVSRKEAYQADITYGTNNEFGFDFLRDNMVQSLDEMVQICPEPSRKRELNFAIIDEVDSILIDEARTPLIISAPAEESTQMYYQFAQLIPRLKENIDFNVDEKMRAATLTEEGIKKMEKWLGVENIYTEAGLDLVYHIEQALKAQAKDSSGHALFEKDRHYVVKDGEVIIVDEFTGRLMFGRRYSEGLHQAIEAKEGVEIKKESQTLATITFQNYFRMYKKLAGMTGTAATSAEELAKVYNLEVVVIPTNKPMIREDLSDAVYKSEKGKFKAVIQEIKLRYKMGQPVLVGTISIEKNELLGEMLEQEGIPHQILNAKNHEKEAEIITQAGRKGTVTIATNMAGRGVDIVLGGNPPLEEEHQEVVSLGGLHVIGTERHEARRIDNQLRGRSGRQGDPGSSQFFVSCEDDLMRIFAGEKMKILMERLGLPDDMPIENKMVSRSIEAAQKKVEGRNFDLRKHLVEYDDVINKHREMIYKKRRGILELARGPEAKAQSLKNMILEMVENEIEQVVSFHTASDEEEKWNIDEIYETVDTIFPVPLEVRLKMEDIFKRAGDKAADAEARTELIEYLSELAKKTYEELESTVNSQLALAETSEEKPMRQIEKIILLRSIDMLWTAHLDAIDHLRTGIGLRGYGQRDPLVEYKKEAYRMFLELQNNIQKQVVYSIYKIGLTGKRAKLALPRKEFVAHGPAKTMEKGQVQGPVFSTSSLPQEGKTSNTFPTLQKSAPFKPRDVQGKKIGRNDPCPCGSGKKYKKCHGK